MGDDCGWLWLPQPAWFPAYVGSVTAAAVCAGICWLWLEWRPIYAGRMLVVPNREVDIYDRLWCVYEIYVAMSLRVDVELASTLAFGGKAASRHATCSSVRDMQRIRAEIEAGPHSYEQIDVAVSRTMRGAERDATLVFLPCIFLFVLHNAAAAGSDPAFVYDGTWMKAGVFLLNAAISIICVGCTFAVFRCAQGVPSFWSVLACAVPELALGGLFIGLEAAHALSGGKGLGCLGSIGSGAISTAALTLVFTVGGKCCGRWLKVNGRVPVTTLCCLAVFAGVTCRDAAGHGTEVRQPRGEPTQEWYPLLYDNAVSVFFNNWVPAFTCWSAILRWGVHIGGKRRARAAATEEV